MNMRLSFVSKILVALFAIGSLVPATSCGRVHHTPAANHLADLGDANQVSAKLENISKLLGAIQGTVMINDEARIQVLNQSVAAALEQVKSKGVVHVRTINSLRKMVMYCIYSEQFFNFIRTDLNSGLIDNVLRATIALDSPSIRVDIGYDDDPMGHILADNLDVVQQRLRELLTTPETPQDVRAALQPLLQRVGYVFGKAKGDGDRPEAYDEGTVLCKEIDAIYPALDKLNGSLQLFSKAQDIRGTNEFLKDFLQVRSRHPAATE